MSSPTVQPTDDVPVALPADGGPPTTPGDRPVGAAASSAPGPSRVRRVAAVLLLVVGCVLTPVAVTAQWARAMVTDQDTYLDAVAPLARNPVVLDALRTRAVGQLDQVITDADPQALLASGLSELGASDRVSALGGLLAPVLQNQLLDAADGLVDRALHSDAFAQSWVSANAAAHTALVGLLDGSADPALARAQATAIRVDSVLDTVRERLTAAGATWAQQIPSVPTTLPLVAPGTLDRAQGYYSALAVLGVALPIAVLLLLAAGVALSRSRWTALLAAALGVLAGLLVLRLALQWAYGAAADASPTAPEVTRIFAEQLTGGLRSTALLVTGVAIVVAVAAGAVAITGARQRGRSARLASQRQQA
ncbi:hypothetical protein FDO65_00720 [Nakamurella flava]|uniref:Integral membrane protein n=1 Tax=Nakamurella flava TaxID=2576308 RepID=A0A4U6QJM8_9ACTN|nr:hypothetical protein [Nakamurella flava]TKV60288.1 hypothetical protein FDO65_00720 [Nakamurella flava]